MSTSSEAAPRRAGASRSSGRHRRRRAGSRRRLLLWLLFALVIVGAVVGLAVWRVVQIGRDLTAARDQLVSVERLLKQGRPAAARAALAAGTSRVSHANSVAYNSPELSLFNVVPIARQNVKALRTSVSLALRMTTSGSQLLDTARPLESSDGRFEVPLRSGAVPLPVIKLLRPQLAELASTLPVARDAPDDSLLLGPVKRLQATLFRESGLRRRQAASLSSGLELLNALSGGDGPRRFLLAIANAAEMRGTGGMVLAYGELTSDAGTFALQHFGAIDELKLTAAPAAPAGTPTDYVNRFADLGPLLNWRSANLGADFTYVAPVMEAMYQKAVGVAADGVIQIDSMGLAALLRGTGPVEVPGLGTVTADNVVKVTLSDAYARFPNDRDQRQEVMGVVAEEVFRKLVTGDYPSLRPLVTALVDAAAQRRIVLHMTRDTDQRQVATIGVEGALPPAGFDFATLTVQNFAGNKLDYYLDTGVRLTGQRAPGAPGRVRAEVTISNTAPPGQTTPAYVFGPFTGALAAGQYVGVASLYLPKGATLADASGDLSAGRPGLVTEAERSVVTFPVRLDAGRQMTVALDLLLPPAAGLGYGIGFVPVSRVRPTTVSVDLDRGNGRGPIRFSGAVLKTVVLSDRRAA